MRAQKSVIRGTVYDQQNNKPVEYASIALLTARDSTVAGGTVTKANGAFELGRVRAGTFRLKISFVGYYTISTDVFTVAGNGVVNMGTITLQPADALLNEMKVTARQLPIATKIDKQTYKADQFNNAQGGTAIDVLKNLPSVSLNGEGAISVRGSSGFLVLVNGKPVITDAQTVLSQLPANSIQSIELITAPSAKYDPDGKGGIINIITKKGANDGITFTANIQGGLPSTTDHNNKEKPKRFGGDMALNYRHGKWDISAGGNYLRADVAGYREGDVYTKNLAANTITRLPSAGERSFDKYNYAARASVHFQADSSNAFAAGFMTGHRFQSRLADLVYNNSKADLSSGTVLYTNTYYNSNLQSKHGTFSLGSLDYTHTFRNKSTLATSALYEHANLYGDTKNRNLGYPQVQDTLQYVYNPYRNPINGYRLKVDYAQKTRTGKWESGYQFRYDTQDGQFDYFVTPDIAQPDAARFRGSATAKNTIHAVYSQYAGRFHQLEYNAGLRYEYATRSVLVSYEANPYQLHLSNLFPSAALLYPFRKGWQAKAGYSKRIQRTTNFELNPIPEREHSETLEQGDPNLLPEFIDLAELGIVHQFTSGNFFSNIYYQHIKNPIQRVNSVYADTILNRVFTNAGQARSLGIEAGASWQLNKWWNIYLGGNVYNYRIKGQLAILGVHSTVSNSNWIYSFNTNNSFKLGNTWTLQATVNYLSRRATAQGEDSYFLTPNTSLKKTFMNGRLAATLQWQNMDMGMKISNRQRISTWGADFYTTTNYIYETDVFLVNLSFHLNKNTSKSKLPGSEFGEKEF
ncbi:TonB-dependent receptor domain-containing protein [Filimonas lacunae]|uniref:TonB-dependent receptor domain-containing protein n=1 Tax=Filimonas lacunae TaxID=477680 RepID=UPI001E366337|nr:TonB-dependent receptor [Filimonas lacunae]